MTRKRALQVDSFHKTKLLLLLILLPLLVLIGLVVFLAEAVEDGEGAHFARYIRGHGAVSLPDVELVILVGAGRRKGMKPIEVGPRLKVSQGQGTGGALRRSEDGDSVHPEWDVLEPRNHRLAAGADVVDGLRSGLLERLELHGQGWPGQEKSAENQIEEEDEQYTCPGALPTTRASAAANWACTAAVSCSAAANAA